MIYKLIILTALITGGAYCDQDLEELEVLNGPNGPRTAPLVAGETALKGKHPWHVGLVREESKTGLLGWVSHLGGLLRTTTYCGASLISKRWLVTAAHCIKPNDRVVDLRVVMGTSKRARMFYYFFQTDSIDQMIIHPDYRNNTQKPELDIALLRLKKVPKLAQGELWPVCLPTVPVASYAGQSVTVIGWGLTEKVKGKKSARYLQELNGTVISQTECQRPWGRGKSRVCFKSSGASCNGDSGSGMFRTESNKQELIGVCSFGEKDCKTWAPNVYTKVIDVIGWIMNTIHKYDPQDELNIEQCGVTSVGNTSGRRAIMDLTDGREWMKVATQYLWSYF